MQKKIENFVSDEGESQKKYNLKKMIFCGLLIFIVIYLMMGSYSSACAGENLKNFENFEMESLPYDVIYLSY